MDWSTVQSLWSGARRWYRRQPTGIGVDVGSHSIKVVTLRSDPDGALHACAVARSAPALPSAGAWLDVEACAAVLREALSATALRAPAAVIAVPSSVAVLRRVVLPRLGRRSFARKIEETLESLELDPNEDWNVDYEILGPQVRGDGQEVLFVAAPADCVATYVELLRQADLVPVAVDVDILAMAQSCGPTETGPDTVTALIDLGESKTSIHLVRGARSLFEARLPVGVRDIAESLAEALALPPAAALSRCFLVDDGDPTQDAVTIAVARVAEEIHHAISFFWTAPGEEAIDRLRLSGGGAAIPALRRWLESRLAAPCHVADPCRDLNLIADTGADGEQPIGPEFALASGLAWRGLGVR